MNENNQRMWLLINNVLTKLKRAKYWTTSIDDYNSELLKSIDLLEEVLRKIENGEKNNS
tara:strand:- start:216 stop:392 length:177 start_codon:yes stop_codon:yes gene_type:complete